MSEIQRYSLHRRLGFAPYPDGDWVSFHDHFAAVEAARKEEREKADRGLGWQTAAKLEAEVARLRCGLPRYFDAVDDLLDIIRTQCQGFGRTGTAPGAEAMRRLDRVIEAREALAGEGEG